MFIPRDELPDNADETIVGFLEEHGTDGAFWSTKTPEERLTAMTHLSWVTYGRKVCSQPMQKVLRVIDRDEHDADE